MLSHQLPLAPPDVVLRSLTVMGECCYAMAARNYRSWAFSVSSRECRLYAAPTLNNLTDAPNATNWHTGQADVRGQAAMQDCPRFHDKQTCEAANVSCTWLPDTGNCIAAFGIRKDWYIETAPWNTTVPSTRELALAQTVIRNSLNVHMNQSLGSPIVTAEDCQRWCHSEPKCQAWNLWNGTTRPECHLLRTIRRSRLATPTPPPGSRLTPIDWL